MTLQARPECRVAHIGHLTSLHDALAREIQDFVKVQLAAHEYPRIVQFAESLTMTATGKVLRRELRALG